MADTTSQLIGVLVQLTGNPGRDAQLVLQLALQFNDPERMTVGDQLALAQVLATLDQTAQVERLARSIEARATGH